MTDRGQCRTTLDRFPDVMYEIMEMVEKEIERPFSLKERAAFIKGWTSCYEYYRPRG